jgi:hypothetical protein
VSSMSRPLRVVSASRTCLSTRSRRTSFVTVRMASALLVTNTKGGSISVRRGYILKTSNVSIRPLGSVKLLTAFTAIYRIISLFIRLSFSSLRIISYKRRRGV